MKKLSKKTVLITAILSLIVIFSVITVIILLQNKNTVKIAEVVTETPPEVPEQHTVPDFYDKIRENMKNKECYKITLPEQEKKLDLIIELIPGQTITTDCNSYFIEGIFSEKIDDDEGILYYEFEKIGGIIGTQKWCPDVYETKFIRGTKKIIPYDNMYYSKFPIIVFLPKNFELKYRVLQLKNYSEKTASRISSDQKEHYEITLPEQENENNLIVELIPGKTMKTDCNDHFFNGEFLENKQTFSHYEFKEGMLISTQMNCRDKEEYVKFVKGPTKMVYYYSNSPIKITVPKDFEVRYRIWQVEPIDDIRIATKFKKKNKKG